MQLLYIIILAALLGFIIALLEHYLNIRKIKKLEKKSKTLFQSFHEAIEEMKKLLS